MNLLKKYLPQITSAITFIGIFFLSYPLATNSDIWFDIKSGQVFSKLGVIHYDVFAYTTKGRVWQALALQNA